MENSLDYNYDLLFNAARAAGYLVNVKAQWRTQEDGILVSEAGKDNIIEWNPLKTDAEAFQLAVKLGIGISFFADNSYTGEPNAVRARHWDFGVINEHMDDYNDLAEAARWAIVKGAAAIQYARDNMVLGKDFL